MKCKLTINKLKRYYPQRFERGIKLNNKQVGKFMKRCGNNQFEIPDILVNIEMITDDS